MTPYKFAPKKLILPAALIAVGAAGVGIHPLKQFKEHLHGEIVDLNNGHELVIDDYLQYAPSSAYLALGLIPGIRSRSNFTDKILALATSHLIMGLTVKTLKNVVDEPRPWSGEPTSFPSGHSAFAFTGAELTRIEYGNNIGLISYAVATTVAILRPYNQRHWVNDIVAGAGIGILSARMAYWLLPIEKRLFGMGNNNNKLDIAVVPSYDYISNSMGIACVIRR